MRVPRDGRSFTVEVTSDGEGLVSYAGSALLAQVADKAGLTQALSLRLAGLKQRRSGHDPGRVVRDLAVMLSDGGDCLADLRAVRDQAPLFGEVASDSTAFRVIDAIASDPDGLDRLRAAHARARARAWKLAGAPARLTIDLDATLIGAHSDKEGAAGIAEADVGVVAMRRDAVRDLTHCNKMFDFIAMRRPVVVSRTRAVEAYFGESCFALFESGDEQDLSEAIRALHRDRQLGERLVRRGAEVSAPYAWEHQRSVYQGIVERLVRRRHERTRT